MHNAHHATRGSTPSSIAQMALRPPKPVSTWSNQHQSPVRRAESRADQLVELRPPYAANRVRQRLVAHPHRIGYLTRAGRCLGAAPGRPSTADPRHRTHRNADLRPASYPVLGLRHFRGTTGTLWHYHFGVQGAGARSDRVGVLVAAGYPVANERQRNPPAAQPVAVHPLLLRGAAAGLDARLGAQRSGRQGCGHPDDDPRRGSGGAGAGPVLADPDVAGRPRA